MESKITFLEAKQKLEALCAFQEKCQSDIYIKLKNWDFDDNQAQQLISHLITNNFINEERYAEAYVNDKYKIKRWGINKIKMYLKQKRISDYSIKKAFNNIDYNIYLNNLNDIAEKKWSEIDKKNKDKWIAKSKLTNHLLSKGYENELVFEIIKKLTK